MGQALLRGRASPVVAVSYHASVGHALASGSSADHVLEPAPESGFDIGIAEDAPFVPERMLESLHNGQEEP